MEEGVYWKGEYIKMNLLLLTKFYPYGTGEAFIENEINVLSEYYDKITIIACDVTEKSPIIRPIPPNVKVYKVNNCLKMKDMVIGISNFFSKEQTISEEMKNAHGLLSKIFLSYFEEKSQRIYRYIEEKHCIDDFCKEPFVFYSYWFFVTARVGILIGEKYKPVYMFTRAHRYDLYEEKNCTNYLPYRQLFLKSYDNVFPCSDNGAKHLKTLYPSLSQNVVTSFLGTLAHGIGSGSKDSFFRIVSCSRTEPVKRVIKIIEALQELDNEGLNVEWTHIGDGSEFDRVQKAAHNKLHHIKYKFTGNMKNSDVMKLYRDNPFDLFINVSSSEGLPVSIMEAISFGIPAIGTDVGGTSEIVIDGVTGKLIPLDFSTSELANVIRNFITAGNMFVSRNSCREFWEEHFQAIPNYRKMCDFVKEKYEKKLLI